MKTVGSLIDRARSGEGLPDRHFNPYLVEASELGDFLLTPSDFRNFNIEASFPSAEEPQRPFIVEVGTYMGKNLIEMANAHEDAFFLGLDITYKRTVKTARRIKQAGITNARVGICDARMFVDELKADQLDGMCVFFPDPWPKARHEKNRLLSVAFLQRVQKILKPGGFLWLKTDSESYYQMALENAVQAGLELGAAGVPKFFRDQDYVTVFEQLFERQGIQPHRAVWYRNPILGN